MSETHFDGKIAQKAIIEQKGKVLLTRDPRLDNYIWEIPGGRMNEGEEPRVALAREIKEELGIDCEAREVVYMEQFFQICDQRNAFLIVYRATLVDPGAALKVNEEEICEVGWFAASEIPTLELYPEYKQALDIYFSNQV